MKFSEIVEKVLHGRSESVTWDWHRKHVTSAWEIIPNVDEVCGIRVVITNVGGMDDTRVGALIKPFADLLMEIPDDEDTMARCITNGRTTATFYNPDQDCIGMVLDPIKIITSVVQAPDGVDFTRYFACVTENDNIIMLPWYFDNVDIDEVKRETKAALERNGYKDIPDDANIYDETFMNAFTSTIARCLASGIIGHEVDSRIHHSIEFKNESTAVAKRNEHPSSAIDNAVKHAMLTDSLMLINNNWVAWTQVDKAIKMIKGQLLVDKFGDKTEPIIKAKIDKIRQELSEIRNELTVAGVLRNLDLETYAKEFVKCEESDYA